MTKVEIIEETANYYNLNNRAYNEKSMECSYLTDDGKMCAVGRCLVDASKFKDQRKSISALFSYDLLNESDLKEQYRGHSPMFWRHLQHFHDYIENWTISGLSAKGLVKKNELLELYKD